MRPAELTYTDYVGGVLVYPHGFGVLVRLRLPAREAEDVIRRCGWSPDSPRWKRIRTASPARYVMGGSAYLTHTAPGVGRKRRKNQPLAAANKAWSTRLYSIGIVVGNANVDVELQGVRWPDVETFLHGVLRLTPASYAIVHLRTAERYVVTDRRGAERIAALLRCTPAAGGGAYRRKHQLVKDLKLPPIAIRTRAKATPVVSVYTIRPGATSAYKIEVRLRGRTRDRRQFGVEDVEHLDEVLLDLVGRAAIETRPKPDRWEPRSAESRISRTKMHPVAECLPAKAWRGSALSKKHLRQLANCHTLLDPETPSQRDLAGQSALPPSIRESDQRWSLRFGRHAMDVKLYCRQDSPLEDAAVNGDAHAPPDAAIADEIQRVGSGLIELVLPEALDPTAFVRAIVEKRAGRKVGVGFVGMNTWGGIHRVAHEQPVAGAEDVVLVIDPTALALTDAVGRWDDARMEMVEGPLSWMADRWKAESLGMAAMLWRGFEAVREACEVAGMLVVVVSVDYRPPAGFGSLRPSFYFTDVRLRSLTGDAGRFWSHCRYLLEQDRQGPAIVTAIKDEAEGRVGRLIWSRWGRVVGETATPKRRRKRTCADPVADATGHVGLGSNDDGTLVDFADIIASV